MQNCRHILSHVGFTPLVRLDVNWDPEIRLFAKLEFYNPTGSVKDRAASYLISRLLELGKIDKDTTMIESTSGNFGIALSAYCKFYGLKFIAVVDPHITSINEMLIRSYGARVVKVTEPDENGGYLLTRIKKVKELVVEITNSYWVNQYGNPYNAEAYYYSLGREINDELEQLDYIFMGVSSGGTITGVSNKIKEKFPGAEIIGVDIVGSVIFGHPAKKRYIPGIGSSLVPDILRGSRIDSVVMVDEMTTIRMCHELLSEHSIFAGGSSGSVFAAVKKYFANREKGKMRNVVMLFADRGERYANTVYNKEWYSDFLYKHCLGNCLDQEIQGQRKK